MAVVQVIRLIHPKHFSHEKNQFKSLAYQESDDGCSVIDTACAISTSNCECAHIRAFYNTGISGDPPVFLRIDTKTLPSGHALTQCDSEPSGDKCHYLIRCPKESKSYYRKTIKITPISAFEICENGTTRPLTLDDIVKQNPRPI